MATYSISDQETLEWLFQNGFDPNDLGKYDLTPLHLAAMVGNTKIVKRLIEQGGSVHCRDIKFQYTPLHLASMAGQFQNNKIGNNSSRIIRLDYRKFVSDFKAHNYESTMIVLLKAGADVNAKDHRGFTPLHYAARQSKQNLVKALLKAGADVNAKEQRGATPLHHATLRKGKNIVEVLLNSGAHVDDDDSEGFSPLYNCLLSENDEGLKCLLTYGADINNFKHSFSDILKPLRSVSIYIAEYIIKMKLGALPLSDVHKSYEGRGLFNHMIHLEYWKEVKKLKNTMLEPHVSLYRWLHMDPKLRFAFIDRLPPNFEDEFPHYCVIIKGKRNEAVNRKPMIEPAKMTYRLLTGLHWPDICVEHVLSFLNNRTLRVLIASTAKSESLR